MYQKSPLEQDIVASKYSNYYVSIFAGSEKNPALFSHRNLFYYYFNLFITFYYNWILVSSNRVYDSWYKEPGYVAAVVHGQVWGRGKYS